LLVYKRNHYSNVREGTGIFGANCELRFGQYYMGGDSDYYVHVL
jgi:hypothetical protein